MNNNLTDITMVVDRSGSMATCQSDAEGGLNAFISDQAKQPGDALLTLVQFDSTYEFVHRACKIGDVPHYHLVPRGMTALHDAVGRAIVETGERLAAMPEEGRPGLVIFTIVTDGEENSSREFTGAQVKEMIERQTNEWNWHFEFLGANQDAFKSAASIGIAANNALYMTPETMSEATKGLGEKMTTLRSMSASGASGQSMASLDYTRSQRSASGGGLSSPSDIYADLGDPPAFIFGKGLPSPSDMSEIAKTLGRAGGKKGGKARADSLTPEERVNIARNAARARWFAGGVRKEK
jgi:hypothetical protein